MHCKIDIFPNSLSPYPCHPFSIIFFLIPTNYLLLFTVWASVLFFLVLLVSSNLSRNCAPLWNQVNNIPKFLTDFFKFREKKHFLSSSSSTKELTNSSLLILNTPEECIYHYRCAQILMNGFNELLGQLVLRILSDVSIFGVVSSVCLLVRFHSNLTYHNIIVTFGIAIISVSFLNIMYTKFGLIQQISAAFTLTMKKRIVNFIDGPENCNVAEVWLIKKFIKSCMAIRVEGIFCKYNKLDGLKVVSKLVVYSNKLLIMTKKVG